MKKIVIIDSTGMAGHVISHYLESRGRFDLFNVVCEPNFPNKGHYVDIENHKDLEKILRNEKPDIIINCSRYLIEESEQHPAKAVYINSFIPLFLSNISADIKAHLIHLSTDCVFSGAKGNYIEADLKDGTNYYAKTKGLGEVVNDRDLTLRTSFIGPNMNDKNEELFHWFMLQKGDIKGYANAYWTGITTLELAKSIEKAIDLNIRGLYHLVPEKNISKYDLLCLIKAIWNKKDVNIIKFENELINKSLIDSRKEIAISTYKEMFSDLYDWMNSHKILYEKFLYF